MANQMWFGIPGSHMQWVPCPSIDSAVSRNRYVERMQFENGGGDARRSAQYQMQYQFNFSGPAHEVEGIDAFNKFAQGFYGDGLIQLAHPATFETNLFPAAWASPGLIEQGWANIGSTVPSFANTNVTSYGQPPRTATWNVTQQAGTYTKSVVIPIPPTHTLNLGVSGVATGSAVVRVDPILTNGSVGTAVDLTLLSKSGSTRMNTTFSGATYQAIRVYSTRLFTTRTNLVTNPSLEVNTTGWSAYQGVGGAATLSRITTDAVSGTSCLQYAWTTATTTASGGVYVSNIPVTVGKTYTASGYVKPSKAQTLRATIEWKNSVGATLSSIGGTITSVSANTWTRLSTSGAAPVNAVTATLTFYAVSPGTVWNVGDTLLADAALFEEGALLRDYFEGTIDDVSTLSITSMMAQLYKTGTTPALPTDHYQGEGSTGLMFADDAIVENYSYMYPPRKGIATTLVEVGAWR